MYLIAVVLLYDGSCTVVISAMISDSSTCYMVLLVDNPTCCDMFDKK